MRMAARGRAADRCPASRSVRHRATNPSQSQGGTPGSISGQHLSQKNAAQAHHLVNRLSCSVNGMGVFWRPPQLEVTVCDFKFWASSSAISMWARTIVPYARAWCAAPSWRTARRSPAAAGAGRLTRARNGHDVCRSVERMAILCPASRAVGGGYVTAGPRAAIRAAGRFRTADAPDPQRPRLLAHGRPAALSRCNSLARQRLAVQGRVRVR
jgi:hypothetical protein